MLSGVLLLFSLGCVESPRYLCKTHRTDQAARALGRLRRLPSDSPSIMDELQVIQKQVAADKTNEGRWPLLEPWKLLFGQAANRSRLLFLISAQLLSQWSGTNAITSKSPSSLRTLAHTINSIRPQILLSSWSNRDVRKVAENRHLWGSETRRGADMCLFLH